MKKTRILIVVALLVAAMTAPAFAGPRLRDAATNRCVTRPDEGRRHSDRGQHRGWERGQHRGWRNGGGQETPTGPSSPSDPSGPSKPGDTGTK